MRDRTDDLTQTEWETLRLCARGWRLAEVAVERGVTEQTVKNTMASIYRKLGARGMVRALYLAGWVTIPDVRVWIKFEEKG